MVSQGPLSEEYPLQPVYEPSPPRVFLLSPANTSALRGQMLLNATLNSSLPIESGERGRLSVKFSVLSAAFIFAASSPMPKPFKIRRRVCLQCWR